MVCTVIYYIYVQAHSAFSSWIILKYNNYVTTYLCLFPELLCFQHDFFIGPAKEQVNPSARGVGQSDRATVDSICVSVYVCLCQFHSFLGTVYHANAITDPVSR